jgi:hypothetical protein
LASSRRSSHGRDPFPPIALALAVDIRYSFVTLLKRRKERNSWFLNIFPLLNLDSVTIGRRNSILFITIMFLTVLIRPFVNGDSIQR